MTNTTPQIPFAPTPAQATAIINELGDVDETICTIANSYGTTLEALNQWFTRPEVSARIDNLYNVIAARARLCAISCMPNVVKTLSTIMREYHEDVRRFEPGMMPAKLQSQHRGRLRETARKATYLISRIATMLPTPPSLRPPSWVANSEVARRSASGPISLTSRSTSAPSSPTQPSIPNPKTLDHTSSPSPTPHVPRPTTAFPSHPPHPKPHDLPSFPSPATLLNAVGLSTTPALCFSGP